MKAAVMVETGMLVVRKISVSSKGNNGVKRHSRKSSRYQKLLNASGCHASTVCSDVIKEKAPRVILDAFYSQDPNFREIVDNSCRQLVASEEEIIDALNITVPPAFLEQLR